MVAKDSILIIGIDVPYPWGSNIRKLKSKIKNGKNIFNAYNYLFGPDFLQCTKNRNVNGVR